MVKYPKLTFRYVVRARISSDNTIDLETGKKVTRLKKGIHPKYEPTTITCACGEVIETRSTKQNIRVEICSKCHPYYTGVQRYVDSGGRVDKFKKRYGV